MYFHRKYWQYHEQPPCYITSNHPAVSPPKVNSSGVGCTLLERATGLSQHTSKTRLATPSLTREENWTDCKNKIKGYSFSWNG